MKKFAILPFFLLFLPSFAIGQASWDQFEKIELKQIAREVFYASQAIVGALAEVGALALAPQVQKDPTALGLGLIGTSFLSNGLSGLKKQPTKRQSEGAVNASKSLSKEYLRFLFHTFEIAAGGLFSYEGLAKKSPGRGVVGLTLLSNGIEGYYAMGLLEAESSKKS